MKIYYSPRFIRQFKKLTSQKQQQAQEKEKLFRQDPFAASLDTRKLTGQLSRFWAFSINNKDRIVFEFVNEGEVIFIKVGDHDIYKQR